MTQPISQLQIPSPIAFGVVNHVIKKVRWLMLVTVTVGCLGCDYIPERPPLIAPERVDTAKIQAEAEAKLIEPPAVGFSGDWEAWYGLYLKGQHVGYAHTSAKRIADESSNAVDANVSYEVQEQLRFRRGQSISVQHLTQSSVETRHGELQSFESALKVGPLVTRHGGTVANGSLVVDTIRGTERKSVPLKWEPHFRGLVAVEQSLRRTPMRPGDKRTLEMLFPRSYQLGTIDLFCTGRTATAMLDGSYQALLEVISTEKVDRKVVAEQVIWTDDAGVILKQLRSGNGMIAYNMDRQSAMIDSVAEPELFDATVVKIGGEIKRPLDAKQVAYVIKPNEATTKAGREISVPTTPGQFIRKMDDGSFQVLVDPSGQSQRQGFSATELEPSAEDQKPSMFIDSNHADIRRIATAAIRGDMTQEEIALTLARTTKDLLNPKSTSEGIVRASAVVQQTTGGSTEYALALAALLRAKGIPSRLAMGIKYVPLSDTMVYQVWTLAHVDDQKWISLDPMTGGYASADRITFVTTNLNDGNHFNAIAAVLTMMSRIDVEIRAAAY